MSDSISLFDDEPSYTSETPPMTDQQRKRLRELFASLNLLTASEQFDLVAVLTGRRIKSPLELNSREAQALLVQLQHRVNQSGRARGGSAWEEREEDTWIDLL